jgi:hypothetical protein
MYVGSTAPTTTKPVGMSETEADRLAELNSYGVLDTKPEDAFDRVVALARVLFDTPMAAVTLVDHDRQWFKARAGIDIEQTSRSPGPALRGKPAGRRRAKYPFLCGRAVAWCQRAQPRRDVRDLVRSAW